MKQISTDQACRLARVGLLVLAFVILAGAGAAAAAVRGAVRAKIHIFPGEQVVIHTPVPTRSGIEFAVSAPGADSVSIIGTWNDWDPRANRMERQGGRPPWRCVIPLVPGAYQFKCRYHHPGATGWHPYPEPVLEQEQIYDEANALTLIIEESGDAYIYIHRSHGRDYDTRFDGFADYNRVDGFAPILEFSFVPDRPFVPLLLMRGGYSFGLEQGNYHGRVELPLVGLHALSLGGELYQRTAHFDQARISNGENFFAAFALSEDFRDYIRDRGGRLFLASRALGRPFREIELAYAVDRYQPVSSQTDWSLFGSDKEFRPNDLFDDDDGGTLRSIAISHRWDTRRYYPRDTDPSGEYPLTDALGGGWAGGARFEQFGEQLGGRFDFNRWDANLRYYTKLARNLHMALRATGGRANGGVVPKQHRFYLGGIGTLRGHEFKSVAGTRYALGNAEIRFSPGADIALSLFTDAGDAWSGDGENAKLLADAGVGIGTRDGSFHVDFARPIDGRSSKVTRVTVRAGRTF